ncbi:MAG: hypothetical protein ACRDOZ_14445 [Nocardioides sp.]
MTSTSLPTTGTASLASMAGIEARRFARHPVFLVGLALAYGLLILMATLDDAPHFGDALSTPVVASFFIGLTSLVTAARLTRSTEVAVEAFGTAPGTESRRTAAVALACLVPFAAGVGWMITLLVITAAYPVHPLEWWFGTMPDWKVWAILLALAPVACLGGGLLGVLTGRWLRFPGAPAVVVVAVVAVTMVGSLPVAYTESSEARLWVPWAMWHSGTMDDGTAEVGAGNPLFYLGYLLCLCAAAALVAMWHDKATRTRQLRSAIVGVVVAGLACLALAMVTGPSDNQISEPIPYKVGD